MMNRRTFLKAAGAASLIPLVQLLIRLPLASSMWKTLPRQPVLTRWVLPLRTRSVATAASTLATSRNGVRASCSRTDW